MKHLTRKEAKDRARETRRALQQRKERVEQYREINVVHRKSHELVGRLGVRYRHSGEEEWTDLGVVSEAVVTNASIAVLVSVLIGGDATTLRNFKWHGTGTGGTAEASTDTTLVTEIGDPRNQGTQVSPSAGIYRTVAIHTYTDTFTIVEHGVFSASTGGTLLDRSVFAGIEVEANTQVEFTYDLLLTGA